MLKRLYHILALVAMVNLFAVGGLVAYLFASGRLNADRMDQIALVLRGEFPEPAVEKEPPVEKTESSTPQASAEEIHRLQQKKEFYRLIADRHKREIEDRKVLGERILLETMELLEAVKAKEQAIRETRDQIVETGGTAGYEKNLELLSSMDPEVAKDLLRTRKDADVVRVLREMDTNRAKRIVEACGKNEEDKIWIGRIMIQMETMEDKSANGVDGSVAAPVMAGG